MIMLDLNTHAVTTFVNILYCPLKSILILWPKKNTEINQKAETGVIIL